jgi:hypothetical protein
VYNAFEPWLKAVPPQMQQLLESGDKQDFDQFFNEGMQRATPAERQNWEWRAKPYGLQSPFDVFTAARKYNLSDVVEQITTPLLITDPEGEQFWPGQSQQLLRNCRDPSNSSPSPPTRAPTATANHWHDHFSNSACSTGSTKPWPRPAEDDHRAARNQRAPLHV